MNTIESDGFLKSKLGCVYEKSFIFIKNNKSLSKKISANIFIDDIIYSPSFSELSINDNLYNWSSKTMSNISLTESKVTSVFEYLHHKLVYFNNDENAKFSMQQPILVKRYNKFYFLTTAMVEVGDILLKYDEHSLKYDFIKVESINIEEGDFTTYNFYLSPGQSFLVNGWVVGSK
jgi:hypothetical protein